ncbi:Aste57867_22062 [Aphanomyces stellatus]|uniref:Aste57867_22062 protein n=1 Tax=Aphanomyces stellatus TaxID=120398 RepID=A0A485LKJ6_9STRA|nr:hypothetical protein As57867_021993 [Aphanomyces stellatus]VFT98730.1 Aste57867_22062 [Aphanomyces stellatus]
MSGFKGIRARKEQAGNELSESDVTTDTETSPTKEGKKKKSGFSFGSFSPPKFITSIQNLNPLKNFGKKATVKEGKAPPPPLKQIAWLFGPKHRVDLWRLGPYLAFSDLGTLARLNEACNEHMIAYFRSPTCMALHVVPTTYLVFQTLLRDHQLSRNCTATDDNIPARILSFLTQSEQVHMTEVCHRMVGIHSETDLRLRGHKQIATFLHGFDIESKAFWTVRARYSRIRSLSCAFLTSYHMTLLTWLVLHDCFPKLTRLAISNVQISGSPTQLATSVIEMLAHVGPSLEYFGLRGIPWTEDAYALLLEHLYTNPLVKIQHLDLAGKLIYSPMNHITLFRMTPAFVHDHFAHLATLDLQNSALHSASFPAVLNVLAYAPLLKHLDISRNDLAVAAWKALAVHMQEPRSIFSTLQSFNCSGCSVNVEGMVVFFDALWSCPAPHLTSLNVASNLLSKEAVVGLGRAFVHETVPQLAHLNLASTSMTPECLELLSASFTGKLFYHESARHHHAMPGLSLKTLDCTGNSIGKGVLAFLNAMRLNALAAMETLVLAKTGLTTNEFDLIAQSFRADCCPRLQRLDLSENNAKGEGLTRFCYFIQTPVAARLCHLDLSHNGLDMYSILRLSETLRLHTCHRLHTLNLSRNEKLGFQTMYHFNETVRSGSCPSLRCLQVGDAVTVDAGYDMVLRLNKTYSSSAVADMRDKIREEKRAAFTRQSELDAIATDLRTKMKCQIRRELYDRLEHEAAAANLRVHPVKKAKKTKLAIHRKIQQEILETLGH